MSGKSKIAMEAGWKLGGWRGGWEMGRAGPWRAGWLYSNAMGVSCGG